MQIENKEQLYQFIKECYTNENKPKQHPMASLYFLVTHDNITEPLYFAPFEDVYFETPCCLMSLDLTDFTLEEYVKETYEKECQQDALEYEKTMLRDNRLYSIECPQVLPFLNKIDNIQMITEQKCLEWLIEEQKEK